MISIYKIKNNALAFVALQSESPSLKCLEEVSAAKMADCKKFMEVHTFDVIRGKL